jgi:uncharacterized membrane protein
MTKRYSQKNRVYVLDDKIEYLKYDKLALLIFLLIVLLIFTLTAQWYAFSVILIGAIIGYGIKDVEENIRKYMRELDRMSDKEKDVYAQTLGV